MKQTIIPPVSVNGPKDVMSALRQMKMYAKFQTDPKNGKGEGGTDRKA